MAKGSKSNEELKKYSNELAKKVEVLNRYWEEWEKLAGVLLCREKGTIEYKIKSLKDGETLTKNEVEELINSNNRGIILEYPDKCGLTIEEIYKKIIDLWEYRVIRTYIKYFKFLTKDKLIELMENDEKNCEVFIESFDEIDWLSVDEKTEIIISFNEIKYALNTIKKLNYEMILRVTDDPEIEKAAYGNIIENSWYNNKTAKLLLDCSLYENFFEEIKEFKWLDWDVLFDLLCYINSIDQLDFGMGYEQEKHDRLQKIEDNFGIFTSLDVECATKIIKLWYEDLVLKYPEKFGLKQEK